MELGNRWLLTRFMTTWATADLAGIGLAAGFVVDVEGEAVKRIAVDPWRGFEGIRLGGGESSDGDDETRCD